MKSAETWEVEYTGPVKRFLRLMTLAIVTGLAFAPGAFSQGCAQCYIEASASGSHAQKSLDVGILVLLLPSLLLFVGVIVLLIRRTRAAMPLKQFPSTL